MTSETRPQLPEPKCYFLAFRTQPGTPFDWDNPTGGLVMDPVDIVGDTLVSDFNLAMDILNMRYHCAEYERWAVAEVLELSSQVKALHLHNQWEREMQEFYELMDV